MKVKKGKGVLGKDKQPFAPNNIFFNRKDSEGQTWKHPAGSATIANLMAVLANIDTYKITEIEVIEQDNTKWTITL